MATQVRQFYRSYFKRIRQVAGLSRANRGVSCAFLYSPRHWIAATVELIVKSSHLTFTTLPLPIPSVALLKLTAFGSP